jgi:hypothetical protein
MKTLNNVERSGLDARNKAPFCALAFAAPKPRHPRTSRLNPEATPKTRLENAAERPGFETQNHENQHCDSPNH